MHFMPNINTYLSNKISNLKQEQIDKSLKYKLELNFYGFLLELNFAHQEDIIHYEYYFRYFINRFSRVDNKLTTNWISDHGSQPFSQTLENRLYVKQIQVVFDKDTFLYDSFLSQPSRPSLIPPLHLNPIDNNHIGFHGAALVSHTQRSVLIFGKNNSGKSTYSVNLILNGYKLLSDDTIIYDAQSNQILAFPRPIGLREGTLKAYPKIKNILYSKQLVRYRAIDYTHLMVSPEELSPGCVIDCAKPYIAIFLNNIEGKEKITTDKIDRISLNKLLNVFSYYSELNPKNHSKNIGILTKKIFAAYIISFDIRLTEMKDLIHLIDDFLGT